MEYDLSIEIPATMDRLDTQGLPASVCSVLDSLGVVMAPTLDAPDNDPSVSQIAPQEVQSLGRFQLGRELGRGGMGRVLEAHDPELRRRVAVKIVIDPSRVTEGQLARFVAEAQITSQLEHPNIPPIHDIGVGREGHLYFVMKKIEGVSLRDVIRDLRKGDEEARRTWTRHRLLSVFVQICNAVAYAHHRGVLHRDLKPDNIMLGYFGEVLVLDWGVARIMSRPGTETNSGIDRLTLVQTSAGQAIGTPGYMSVEQTLGEVNRLTERSDIWSLGAILYEMLTWRRAYIARTTHEMLRAVCSGPPEDPRQRAPDRAIPDALAATVNRALATAPEQRHSTVEELAEEVRFWLEGNERREAARAHLDGASTAWVRYQALSDERDRLRDQLTAAAAAALEQPAMAGEYAELMDRMEALEKRRSGSFERVLTSCEQGLARDPDNIAGRSMLARAYLSRSEEADASGDRLRASFYESRVRLYDDGRFSAELAGEGMVSLQTEPPGAVVTAHPMVQTGLVWERGEPRTLGTTPLENRTLGSGSWVLEIDEPESVPTSYPVQVRRAAHWDAGDHRIELPKAGSYDTERWVYIPAGRFLSGANLPTAMPPRELELAAFLISRYPVTAGDFATMRDETSDGDPNLPVTGVTWAEACEYAQWLTDRHGVHHSLPTLAQWEKAARGVDGRGYPWGDRFDAMLCRIRTSRAGRPSPVPVGTYLQDVSPYGVRDLAGLVREWCLDQVGGDPSARPTKGGSWKSGPAGCAAAAFELVDADEADDITGFRLIRALP